MTEAEVGKKYILGRLPQAKVIKEDISVEFIGNYAFSKPLLMALISDEIIIYTSRVMKERAEIVSKRILANDLNYTFDYLIKNSGRSNYSIN